MFAHVHIITLSDNDLRRCYLLSQLVECWQEQGIKVTVGQIEHLEADIGILHVDRTRVPASCLPANPLGRPILNARALDISKRHISTNILSPDTDYAGQVIVKTDANYFGLLEFSQLPFWSMKRLRQKLEKKLGWRTARELPLGDYPVLNCMTEVPRWVWRRNDLVVERFLPEIENGEYVLRLWLFLGDKEYSVKMYSPKPIVKAANISRYEYLDSVPDSLRTVRAELAMDYGKFDYVMVNGEAILLDANKTPTVSKKGAPSENMLRLASGLQGF